MSHVMGLLLTIPAVLAATGSIAASLAPHRAVYDLVLTSKSMDLLDGSGRIAIELRQGTCGTFDLDYRFVARFEREDATVVTDQQTVSTENTVANTFTFTTKTFVDGAPAWVIRGQATNSGSSTRVDLQEPEVRSIQLPLSVFPSAHTRELVEKAKAGESIVETRLFDGDNEADKLLSTTALITPIEEDSPSAERVARELPEELRGLQAWRVNEAYYNSDSDPEGLPLFQTTYTLFENGISGEIAFDTGDYGFAGTLTQLDLLAAPDCPRQ
ncbi:MULTISPECIES: EipB family protein [Aurantimonadaceae]|uniref:DUF1849 family protein n=1 Tax=Jiella pelagia TaxID=2986949 RepID=A0ABY7C6S0_9HYPH|nr:MULTISPECIES: DUF1849 family protein [Aurantimonadaceae]ORE96979.1 hypothetical protein ATO4_10779 [Aurantimonas sp. 22II-16-19i]WAP71441.1 DUF1849 family protein [Jiella pelagia]|tara:strand:- start:985 stop:1797 length:813 start_codon:yes stop_codon:yes gene_type:complete